MEMFRNFDAIVEMLHTCWAVIVEWRSERWVRGSLFQYTTPDLTRTWSRKDEESNGDSKESKRMKERNGDPQSDEGDKQCKHITWRHNTRALICYFCLTPYAAMFKEGAAAVNCALTLMKHDRRFPQNASSWDLALHPHACRKERC